MQSFEFVVTVSKVPKMGKDARFWAVQALAIEHGDCLFNETRCEDLGEELRYTFKGTKEMPKPDAEKKPDKPTKKPKKAPKRKMTLLERLAK